MKNIKLNQNQDRKAFNTGTEMMKGAQGTRRKLSRPSSIFHPLSSGLLALTLALAGGGCTLRQAYPETQIRGYINGQPFSVNAPKDSNLTGFDAIAETNGAIHVHIDSLQCSLNPTNLANAAAGQAAIVTATGQVMNQAFQAAASTALKAAATAP